MITFRRNDATVNLPNFDFGYDGDIYFEFKTATENGIIVHSKGPEDEIQVELVRKFRLKISSDFLKILQNISKSPRNFIQNFDRNFIQNILKIFKK